MLHRRGFLVSSMAAAAAASLSGVASGAIRRFGKPRPAKDAEHGVVYRNEGEFCAWPYTQGFFETADGTLIANFISTKADYGKPDSLNHNVVMRGGETTLLSARSHDRGKTWDGEPLQAHRGNTLGAHDGSGESIAELGPLDFADRNTLVWSQCSAFGTPNSRPYVRLSKDAGRNWSRSYRLPMEGLPAISSNSSQMVRADGRSMLFLTMISKDGWSRRPMVYLSAADQSTWHFLSFITPKEDPFGATDGDWATTASSFAFGGHRWFYPRGIQLPSGRILCTLRSQRSPQGDMWSELYYSDDGGDTWQFRSRINDFGAPTSLVRMQDGRLVAVFGYRLPPYGVRAVVSEDEGQTWNPEIVLRDDGGSWDLGYPQAVESSRGKVLAVYYFNSKNDKIQANGGVRHIARTVFTPD
jgi:Neuraminidase (sialidase)